MTIEELQKHLELQRRKYYLKSFFRKAKRLICSFLPLNSISGEYIHFYKKVRNSFSTVTYLPKSFNNPPQSVEVKMKDVEIYGLKNIWAVTDSTFFLTKDLKTVYYEKIKDFSDEYTLLYNTNTLSFHSHHLAKLQNLKKKEINEEAVFLGGTFSFNYFHFLIEYLPKFQFIHEIPNFESKIIIADTSAEKNNNLKTLLSFFTKQNKVKFLSPDNYYMFNTLWHITLPNSTVPNIGEGEKYLSEFTSFSSGSIDYVRNICMDNFDISQVKIKKISRIFFARKSEFRKYNEAELLSKAIQYGFEPVYLEELNIHEQIFLMQNADFIIGPSGAAWTNIIFSEANKTKGLIWLGNVWGDFSVFSTLAQFVNFDLYHLRFDSPDATFHSEYYISPSFFEGQLQKLLNL